MEQQAALEDELKRRRQAMNWVAKAQKNPNLIYQNDPGLVQLRQNRLNDIRAQYAAKYGGTEGGAFARDIMSGGAAFDRAALDSAINQRMGMVNATQPAVGMNAQYGGTTGGALASAAAGGIDDYTYYNYLLPMMLSYNKRTPPVQGG